MGRLAAVLGRFGDEESTLFDQYERLSFEVQLNQAILGRSLSEPTTLSRSRTRAAASLSAAPPPPPPPPKVVNQVKQQGSSGAEAASRRHKSRIKKVFNKFLKPILSTMVPRKDVPNVKDHKLWKAFSRSLRV